MVIIDLSTQLASYLGVPRGDERAGAKAPSIRGGLFVGLKRHATPKELLARHCLGAFDWFAE
jgi:hypothetical protein